MPVCPIHNVEMASGQWGYHCTVKVGIGLPGANSKGYCTQQVKLPGQTPPARPAGPQAAPQIDSGLRARLGALDFAGRLHAGSGDPGLAIQTAEIAVAWLRRL
jgi:hypothetical protein